MLESLRSVKRPSFGTRRQAGRCVTPVSFSPAPDILVIAHLASSIVAWPDARNAATVRGLKEKAEKTMFTTPEGELQGEEGVQAITGLPFR